MGLAVKSTLFGIILFLAPKFAGAQTFYVSPTGDDRWSGTDAEFQGALNGPKKTLASAIVATEVYRASKGASLSGPVTIQLQGGTYELSDTVSLTSLDSGTIGSPLIIEAAPNQTPILSGGTSVQLGRVNENLWTTPPTPLFAGSPFTQFYVNGTRRQRVKMPKSGYYYVAGPSNPRDASGPDQFQFAPGNISSTATATDMTVRAFQNWNVFTLQVSKVDPKTSTVYFGQPPQGKGRIGFDNSIWYLVENVSDAPLSPGEWHLDPKELTVSYAPLATERTSEPTTAVAPRLETLLTITGSGGNGPKASYITIRGITFAYTDWKMPKGGLVPTQGAVETPGTVFVTSVRNVVFDQCSFIETGAYGLVIDADVQQFTVENSVFHDLGAGGIRLGSFNYSALNNQSAWAENNTVYNNIVAAYGQVHPDAAGIMMGYAGNSTIKNNEVTNGYYTGISTGWVWGYGLYAPKANVIQQNRIWHIGQSVLSDLAGIYTLGQQPGTLIYGNIISDVTEARYGGWGIYFDQGSASITAKNNLVYDVSEAPVHIHWGKNLDIESNILVFGALCNVENTTPEQTGYYKFANNVLVTDSTNYWGKFGFNQDPDAEVYGNTYISINPDKKLKLFPAKMNLAAWKAYEPTADDADPGFANPTHANFAASNPEVLSARGIEMSIFENARRVSGPKITFVQGSWWDPAPQPQ